MEKKPALNVRTQMTLAKLVVAECRTLQSKWVRVFLHIIAWCKFSQPK